jgi:hypothetical protein
MNTFLNLFTSRFGVTVAAAWGFLPGNDADAISAANLFITVLLGYLTLKLNNKQSRFAQTTKEEEDKLKAEQKRLQTRQLELETSNAARNSLNLHHDILDKLVELNKIEITDPELFIYISKNHNKNNFVVPPSKYAQYNKNYPDNNRTEILNAKACGFLYLQINIFDMYFLYRDTEQASIKTRRSRYGKRRMNDSASADNHIESDQDQEFYGPADSKAWLRYTNEIMGRALYKSFYEITKSEWGRPFQKHMHFLARKPLP